MSFKRTIEDFVCEHCGGAVKGTGYTNHCPKCLWSKHVDASPGDRESVCGGMMEPVRVETKGAEHRLVHRCVSCGDERINTVSSDDEIDALVRIAKQA